jgi:hypothetical protein
MLKPTSKPKKFGVLRSHIEVDRIILKFMDRLGLQNRPIRIYPLYSGDRMTSGVNKLK